MVRVDWHDLDLGELSERLRAESSAPDADRTIWAFEQVLTIARGDPELLEFVLAAAVCLVARSDETTPRHVLKTYLRRAPTDARWHDELRPLLD